MQISLDIQLCFIIRLSFFQEYSRNTPFHPIIQQQGNICVSRELCAFCWKSNLWSANTSVVLQKIVYVILDCAAIRQYIDGLVQERCNSSALAMELRLSCTNPSICWQVNIKAWEPVPHYWPSVRGIHQFKGSVTCSFDVLSWTSCWKTVKLTVNRYAMTLMWHHCNVTSYN